MDYKAIQELIKTVSDSQLTLVELETEGMKIKLEKKQEVVSFERIPEVVKTVAVEQQIPVISELVRSEENEQVRAQQVKQEGTIVTSPIVGTFYASPGPNAEVFVSLGSKVKKGQVLCIIEAMKLMNEIESEIDGEVAEILVENEQMVEFGQPLFRIV
ncbi:acetyl-CoA carboxylase biotin carboxyl carrier protein [Clostridium swellfunianum]|uniref:acetyl-CoA carboxylase biotin carboxyl carrier protein n=1 Tax=Clostridium swellfunianum TaxID=1367462 RepID=UPI00202EABE1|nr:acetyl-CoA carboxylase biotin carboxyl carrier protein [Clostridium swellfunianum]MCM0650323.1 acetyl-CoA carboxylase biotin carboxyl carrier protein [Clostridium swellfunianum]